MTVTKLLSYAPIVRQLAKIVVSTSAVLRRLLAFYTSVARASTILYSGPGDILKCKRLSIATIIATTFLHTFRPAEQFAEFLLACATLAATVSLS